MLAPKPPDQCDEADTCGHVHMCRAIAACPRVMIDMFRGHPEYVALSQAVNCMLWKGEKNVR